MTRTAKKSPTKAAKALAREVTADPRWASVVGRDAGAEGRFFYSVETTGVFCRPSCPARTPRPENVAFHESIAAAERAGFRACRRCKPGQPPRGEQYARQIAELCRFIEDAEHSPSLSELAERAGMSPYHLHRVFKAVTGLTPRAYAASRRAERVRTELGRGQSVTAAIYAAGFSSNGHFYARSDHALGMTPSRYRDGGHEMQIRFAIGQCSLGSILVAASERGVCAILLGDDPDQLAADLERRFPRASLGPGDSDFELLVARVVGLIEAPRVGLELPLDLRGTAFQERVWRALQRIPPGKTASYTDIAAHVGAPAAVRAVARACAQNPVAVAIPCHRVVRVDGGLAGYRWGVERKRELLQREAEPC